jgi:hypothetical protein
VKYVYSVVRFVPNPARGEFVNVGAILGSEDSSEWQVRQVENPIRARAVDESGVLGAAWDFLNRVGKDIDSYEEAIDSLFTPPIELSEDWLWKLVDQQQNIVQLSPPTPLVADSLDQAMEIVFEELLVDPQRHKRPFLTKHAALSATRRVYRERGIDKRKNLREFAHLATANHRQTVDFAVADGRIVQLTQAWSFQHPDQELLAEQVKAWAWTMKDLRQSGGHLIEEQPLEVLSDVDIEVVFIPPAPDQDAPALPEAEHAFAELDVATTPMDDADKVAEKAAALLL